MDMFDSILDMEKEFSAGGRRAGIEQGRKEGREAGFKEGVGAGCGLVSELANIKGFVETWCTATETSPRAQKLARDLAQLIEEFPSESNIYEESDMIKIRSKFKLFIKHCNCSEWFVSNSIQMSW